MRIRFRVGLLAVCLGLAGCTSAPKKDASGGTGQPFTGAPVARPRNADPTAPPEVDNLLAGEVLNLAYNKRVSNASIQVVDLQDPNPAPAARLDVKANPDGYFFIPGLQRGHHYQLLARIKEGDHVLSGTTLAMPPNPRLSIYLSEDYTTPSTPAPLGPPTIPGKAPADGDGAKTPAAPSASIDPPIPGRTDGGFDPSPAPGAGPPPVDRTKIADGNTGAPEPGGFQKYPAPAPAAIPNAPPPLIPPPPPLPSAAPAAPPAEQVGRKPARVPPPYCVLVGDHLDDLALSSLDGPTWQFRRDPPRKLVLLDFWKTTCPPCQSAVKYLRAFQSAYGPDGLEVVGIAYEDPGRPAEQLARLRNARQYLHINYTILLGADSPAGPCPVRSQFLVDSFPRLVLINGNGDILWRSSAEGMSAQAFRELETVIDRTLHPLPK